MSLALLSFAILGMSQAALMIRWAHAPVEAIGAWRQASALAIVALVAWRRWDSWRRLSTREKLAVPLAGALFFAHLWCFTFAAQHTSVAHAMIGFEIHPVLTGLGAWLFFEETLTARLFLAWALAAAGIAALISGVVPGVTSRAGDASALAAALAFSCYVLLGKGARRKLDNWVFMTVVTAVVWTCFLITGLARGVPLAGFGWNFYAAIACLVIFVSIGGHAIFTHLLATMDVNALSCAKLLEPVLAAVGAWLVIGERLRARTLVAFALVTAAVLLILLPARSAARLPVAEVEDD